MSVVSIFNDRGVCEIFLRRILLCESRRKQRKGSGLNTGHYEWEEELRRKQIARLERRPLQKRFVDIPELWQIGCDG
jgi:hypothetical protein